MNGREAHEAEPVLGALPDLEQYIFCSSAGVYKKSDQMPHREEDEVDYSSRHKVQRAGGPAGGQAGGRAGRRAAGRWVVNPERFPLPVAWEVEANPWASCGRSACSGR